MSNLETTLRSGRMAITAECLPPRTADAVAIRKLAHVTEFGVFSIAVFHGIRGSRTGWRLKWAVLTLLIAISFAALDEWHQSFVPLREARLRDVGIDGSGALLAQAMVWTYAKLSSRSGIFRRDQTAQ